MTPPKTATRTVRDQAAASAINAAYSAAIAVSDRAFAMALNSAMTSLARAMGLVR